MRKITITAILVSLITVVAVYAQTGLNNTEDSVQLAKWKPSQSKEILPLCTD